MAEKPQGVLCVFPDHSLLLAIRIVAGEVNRAQLTLNWLPPTTQKTQTRSSCDPPASLKMTWRKGAISNVAVSAWWGCVMGVVRFK